MLEKLRKKTFEEILYYLSRHIIGRKHQGRSVGLFTSYAEICH